MSNKQSNLIPKGTRKRTTNKAQNQQDKGNNKDQSRKKQESKKKYERLMKPRARSLR